MSVTVRPYRTGGWQVDMRVRLAGRFAVSRPQAVHGIEVSGAALGRRSASGICCSTACPQPKKEVPTLEEFAPRFMDGHARANRQKPSGIAAKEMLLRVHLVPVLRTQAAGRDHERRRAAFQAVDGA